MSGLSFVLLRISKFCLFTELATYDFTCQRRDGHERGRADGEDGGCRLHTKMLGRQGRGGGTPRSAKSTARTDGFLRGKPTSVSSCLTAQVTEALKRSESHIEEAFVAVGGLFQYQDVTFVNT